MMSKPARNVRCRICGREFVEPCVHKCCGGMLKHVGRQARTRGWESIFVPINQSTNTVKRIHISHIDSSPTSHPGDMPPDGYTSRAQWADVQLAAGLKQRRCGNCSMWFFPQELSGHKIKTDAIVKLRGMTLNHITLLSPVCKGCAKKLRLGQHVKAKCEVHYYNEPDGICNCKRRKELI